MVRAGAVLVTVVVVALSPGPAHAAPVGPAFACARLTSHTLAAGDIPSGLSMRNGTVVFAVAQGSAWNAPSAIVLFDVATGSVVPMTPFSTTQLDVGPDFVNDDFIVYRRWLHTVLVEEMRGHWRGPDGAWATADDLDWAIDAVSVPIAQQFGDPQANEGWIAYSRDQTSAPDDVRHCAFDLTDPNPCLPGLVAIEPQIGLPVAAHPLLGGSLLVGRATSPWTDWQDPGQSPVPWLAEIVLDTYGPLVLTEDPVQPALHVSVATNPASAPFWTIPIPTLVDASISTTASMSGNLRVAGTGGGPGFVAELAPNGTLFGWTAHSAYAISPDGDDVAYATASTWPNVTIWVEECL